MTETVISPSGPGAIETGLMIDETGTRFVVLTFKEPGADPVLVTFTVPIFENFYRHLGLDHFDGLVGKVGGRIRNPLDAVAIGPGAPGADQHLVKHILPPLPAAARRHEKRAALGSGNGPLRHHLGQGSHDGVEHAITDDAARPAGRGVDRIQQAAFGRAHGDRFEVAVAVGDVAA